MNEDISFRQLNAQDLEVAIKLEGDSYPPDEAATPDRVAYRFERCAFLQFGAFRNGMLIGLILATATASESITEESMARHEELATTLCIHSVCTLKSLWRQGVATRMCKEYIKRVSSGLIVNEEGGRFQTISIIVHQHLVQFYTALGFTVSGTSSIVHGSEPWLEMILIMTV